MLVAASGIVSAQTWVTTTDDYLVDQVTRIVQTRDGRFLAVANTGRALALIKRNSDGSLLWQRQLMGSPSGEGGFDGFELPDGSIAVAGEIIVDSHQNRDAALVVVSADAGTVLLQRAIGGPEGDDRARGLVPASGGGFLLVGETSSWGGPGRRMFLVRVGAEGDPLWVKVIASSGGDDVLYSGVELPTGEFLVAGGSGSVLKLDPDGGLLWSRTYGLTEIRRIAPAPDGHFVLAGWRALGSDDAAELIEIDEAGQIAWRATYGQPGVTFRYFTVTTLADSGFLAGGEVNGPGFTAFDGWVVRLDRMGNIVWQRRLDGRGEVHSVAEGRDGSLLAAGFRGSFPSMMVARLGADGGVPGCNQAPTSAARMVSSAGWIGDTRTEIEPASLAITDTNKVLMEPIAPEDQTFCAGGPTYPPSEASPPAASAAALIFLDEQTLEWEEPSPSAAASFALYRGDLPGSGSGAALECLIGDLTVNVATDQDLPSPGAAFVYVVAGANEMGGGSLGHASDGSQRPPATPCP